MIYRDIIVGKTYQHYKGNHYQVIAIARDSENPKQKHVIYKALYDVPEFGKDTVWSRNYTMFAEKVIIDGVEQYRFKEIDL